MAAEEVLRRHVRPGGERAYRAELPPPRVRHADAFDAEIDAHNVHFRAAAAIRQGENVLDIGCGTGQSTRQAAAAAAPGHVLGVDISAPLLEHARRLTAAARQGNVTYQQGDAQVHRFAAGHHDVAISRFGAMFFADPIAAFENIGEALRRGGRLVLLVWQGRQQNEWATAIDAALWGELAPPAAELDPFSLGDPATAERILQRAGFSGIRFAEVREPVFYGPDVAAALQLVRGFQDTRTALAGLDRASAARVEERLRDTLAAHRRGERGVLFDSRAWIITATW